MTGFGGLFIVVVIVVVVAVMVECRTKSKKGVEQQLKGKHFIHWQQRLYHNASTSTQKNNRIPRHAARKQKCHLCMWPTIFAENSNMRHQLIESNNFVLFITFYTFIQSFIQFLSHWNFNTSLINSLKTHLHIQTILLLTIHC